MNKLKFFLWGIVSLHTLLGLSYMLFWGLPALIGEGAGTSTLLFLLYVVLFGLNLFVCYLLGVQLGGGEDFMEENTFRLIPWALLGFIFVPLTLTSLTYYNQYRDAPVVLYEAGKTALPARFALFKVGKDSAVLNLMTEKKFKHTYKSSKSNQTQSYLVHYKIAPLVSHDWTIGKPVYAFLAYNDKEKTAPDFDTKHYLARLNTMHSYQYNYERLAKESELYQDFNLKIAPKPLFFELIDYPNFMAWAWWYVKLFYGLLVGGWLLVGVVSIFQKAEEQ